MGGQPSRSLPKPEELDRYCSEIAAVLRSRGDGRRQFLEQAALRLAALARAAGALRSATLAGELERLAGAAEARLSALDAALADLPIREQADAAAAAAAGAALRSPQIEDSAPDSCEPDEEDVGHHPAAAAAPARAPGDASGPALADGAVPPPQRFPAEPAGFLEQGIPLLDLAPPDSLRERLPAAPDMEAAEAGPAPVHGSDEAAGSRPACAHSEEAGPAEGVSVWQELDLLAADLGERHPLSILQEEGRTSPWAPVPTYPEPDAPGAAPPGPDTLPAGAPESPGRWDLDFEIPDAAAAPSPPAAAPAEPGGRPELKLEILIGDQSSLWTMPGDTALVGRRDFESRAAPDIDLWPDLAVSRRHLQISYDAGRYYVMDLRSSNGTHVNGRPLNPYALVELAEGDRVLLGESCEIRVLRLRAA